MRSINRDVKKNFRLDRSPKQSGPDLEKRISDAVRSQVINALEAQAGKETGPIYRKLATLSDIRPLFEYCGRKVTIRFCFLCDTQFVRLGRVPFGKTNLPVHHQQLCEIVDRKTIVLGIGKRPFCVLDFAVTVSHEASQNGGVTA